MAKATKTAKTQEKEEKKQKRMANRKRKSINLNELATRVCKREGGKVNLSRAQIKEAMRCLLVELALLLPDEEAILKTVRRYAS